MDETVSPEPALAVSTAKLSALQKDLIRFLCIEDFPQNWARQFYAVFMDRPYQATRWVWNKQSELPAVRAKSGTVSMIRALGRLRDRGIVEGERRRYAIVDSGQHTLTEWHLTEAGILVAADLIDSWDRPAHIDKRYKIEDWADYTAWLREDPKDRRGNGPGPWTRKRQAEWNAKHAAERAASPEQIELFPKTEAEVFAALDAAMTNIFRPS